MTRKSDAMLTEAMHGKTLVKFWSPFEPDSTQGYVLDIGPRFFMLGLVDNSIMFNGFQCMRLSDVRRLRVPDPYADFIVAALRKRGEVIRKKPRVSLNSLPELLRSANRLFPLMTIQQERTKPDTCEIGRVVEITKSHVSLLEIGPDAIWDDEQTEISLREITRVDFGGAYEDALHLVGGDPPRSKFKSRKLPGCPRSRFWDLGSRSAQQPLS
jgi:hypothetical protein